MLLITQLSLAPSNYITPVTVLEPLISNTSILFLNNVFRVHTSQINTTVGATVPSNTPILCLYRSLFLQPSLRDPKTFILLPLLYLMAHLCLHGHTCRQYPHPDSETLPPVPVFHHSELYLQLPHPHFSGTSSFCSVPLPFISFLSHTHALPNSTRAV